MAPTLEAVVATPGLGLAVLVGADRLDSGVRWAHATELVDPTPYLDGGELLLTTGMRLSSRTAAAYVDRLVARGVVGLGFGTGAELTHRSVPRALVGACERAELPLLEVPQGTPFIQISRTVSGLIAAEERRQLARSLDAQRALTRAALGPERSAGVVARLARDIGGWAIVTTPAGEVVHAEPAPSPTRLASVVTEIGRLRPKGLHAGASASAAGERVTVQPLGTHGRPRAYLAVGAPEPWGSAITATVAFAVSLLSLEHERTATDRTLHQRMRSAAVSLLLAGRIEDLPLEAFGWSRLVDTDLEVVVGHGSVAAVADARDRIDDLAPESVMADVDGELVAAYAAGDARSELLLDAVATAGLTAGRARAQGLGDLATGVRHAREAAASPSARPGRCIDHRDLAGVELLGLVAPEAAHGFSDRVLAPLDAAPAGADLIASLGAWLDHHGQWDAAAQALGIHRHTLRHRIRRAEQLLGRSVDDPAVRMELWFAIRTRG
jgi:purine catabolism regulator